LRKNYEVEAHWVAFPLHPEIPEDGLTFEELFAGRRIDVMSTMRRLKQVADELGLPMADRKRTYNSRLAQELAKWAESKGKGDQFHEAVFMAYFVDGKNIGKVEELVYLVRSIGLPVTEAINVLEARTFKEAVDSDWSISLAMGITAVPTFVVDRHVLVGAQPYMVLEQFLRDSGVKKRKNEN